MAIADSMKICDVEVEVVLEQRTWMAFLARIGKPNLILEAVKL
jgi:hypothetical protein